MFHYTRFRFGNSSGAKQLVFCVEFSARIPSMPLGTNRRIRCRVLALVLLSAAGIFFLPAKLTAQQSEFVVSDVVVRGNDQIETGDVLSNLPIRAGDTFRAGDGSRLIRALYDTELFDDISLARDGTTLIVQITERPTIAEIDITGNEDLQTDQLLETLDDVGLATGRIFRRAVLDNLETELRQVYFSRGQYGTQVESTVEELERNRVSVSIEIDEGVVARISHMNIVGNENFTEAELLKLLASGTRSLNPFSTRDKYSRAKLSADTEALRAWYFDRGYLRFDITSTQVTISPDKYDINVTINVDEGEQYSVGDVSISGLESDFVVGEESLLPLVSLKEGDIYSRKLMTESSSAISDRLGEAGYAFADVNVVPDLDDENNTVSLQYVLNPGKRVYVRRIVFNGQDRTQDEVLRREMRQMEGSRFSPAALNRSQTRLQRLPYIDRVSITTPRVPGSDDLVDISVNVLEGASGSFGAGAGFGSDGFLFQVNFTQENLFGSGERLSLAFDNSTSQDNFSISYTDPYYTNDGISRNVRAFVRNTDTGELDSTANFILDSYGARVRYGVPLSEFSTFSFGLGYERVEVISTEGSAQEINDFIAEEGDEHDLFDVTVGYTHDTRDRTIFATSGARNSLSLEATSPNSDLTYLKLGYNFEYFYPLSKALTLAFSTQVSYGEGEEDLGSLPFFRRFFAGGIQSVRGYARNTLGPRDEETEDAVGGDFRTTGSFEVIFPPPFTEINGATRLSLFVDYGNVWRDVSDFEADELRGSYGLSFVWLAPIGPLTFSYAQTFNDDPTDVVDNFQFTIGSLF